MIAVVGGMYQETCMHPDSDAYMGSGGRALYVLKALDHKSRFYTFLDTKGVIKMICLTEEIDLHGITGKNDEPIKFLYHHSLETPVTSSYEKSSEKLIVNEEHIIQFGMLEGDAEVHGSYVVYDPQNPKPDSFYANGSTAKHLALVLNEHEATKLANEIICNPHKVAQILLQTQNVEVLIIKMGPKGLLVCDKHQTTVLAPYQTENVWKIGSGDTFVATFGYYWMEQKMNPIEAASLASIATAYYVNSKGNNHITEQLIHQDLFPAVAFSDRYSNENYKPKIYLAGPFFSLSQLWLIDEVRKALTDMGMEVFSPYHEVGLGPADKVVDADLKGIDQCDIVYAIADGLDSGTLFEIGYAISQNKPVVIYVESETTESMKMMDGAGCYICDDFATSIYRAVWTAVGT